MEELSLQAKPENLGKVLEFVENQLMEVKCVQKTKLEIDIAVEEIFVNIANYAYGNGSGSATIRVEVNRQPLVVKLTFIDNGVRYNPLAHEDPDLSLSAEERSIGGLGIYMVKQSMDDICYEYRNGQNIFTIQKRLD